MEIHNICNLIERNMPSWHSQVTKMTSDYQTKAIPAKKETVDCEAAFNTVARNMPGWQRTDEDLAMKVFHAEEAKKPLVKPVEAAEKKEAMTDFKRQPKPDFKEVLREKQKKSASRDERDQYDSKGSKLRNEVRLVAGYDRHGKRVVL